VAVWAVAGRYSYGYGIDYGYVLLIKDECDSHSDQ
jgi:hypothetical protein